MRRDECASPLLNSALSPSPRFVGYQGDGRPHPGSLLRDKAVLRKLPPQMRRVVATGRVSTFEAHVCLGKRQKFAGGMILGFHRVARHGLQIPAINIECILSLTPGTGSRMFQACRRMLFLSPEFRNAPYGIIFAQCLDERCGLGGFWKVRLVHLPYRVSPAHSTLPDTGSSLRKSSCGPLVLSKNMVEGDALFPFERGCNPRSNIFYNHPGLW